MTIFDDGFWGDDICDLGDIDECDGCKENRCECEESCMCKKLKKEIVCECGSEKVGSPKHSPYCPKYKK